MTPPNLPSAAPPPAVAPSRQTVIPGASSPGSPPAVGPMTETTTSARKEEDS